MNGELNRDKELPLELLLSMERAFKYWGFVLKEQKFWFTIVTAWILSSLTMWIGSALLSSSPIAGMFLIEGSKLVATFVFSLFYFLIGAGFKRGIAHFEEEYAKLPWGTLFKFIPAAIGWIIGSFFLTVVLVGLYLLPFPFLGVDSIPRFLSELQVNPIEALQMVQPILIWTAIYLIYVIFVITNLYGKVGEAYMAGTFIGAVKPFVTALYDISYFRALGNKHLFVNSLSVIGVSILLGLLFWIINLGIQFITSTAGLSFYLVAENLLNVLQNGIMGSLIAVASIFAHFSAIEKRSRQNRS